MGYTLGPFQLLRALHVGPRRVWLILTPGSYVDLTYDGEFDGIKATPGLFYNDPATAAHRLGRFTSARAMLDVLLPMAKNQDNPFIGVTSGPTGVAVLTWTPTTEHPTEPEDLADWTLFGGGAGSSVDAPDIPWVTGSLTGELPYSVGFGQTVSGGTDGNCPPERYNTQGSWSTIAHAESYADYQLGLTPSLHPSVTIFETQTDDDGIIVSTDTVSCVVGA